MEIDMSTPHNEAGNGDIAGTVLMPGDPLRAKVIADTFLEDVVCFNRVRNMFGYTGTYKGSRVSVMGSGMGMPSIAIYSHELYTEYDVDTIIRIGTAGGVADDVKLRDIVIAMGASTDSNMASQYHLGGTFAPLASFDVMERCVQAARAAGACCHIGNVLSTDSFYSADADAIVRWKSMGILAVEMETAALYMNAAYLGKRALGIFTVSDHMFTHESLSADQRQNSFTQMMEIALEVACNGKNC
jgi:purine-nucleoside phosphorylase